MRRSKTPLALMEQLIMTLVFALAAALCLQAFVWADQTSDRGQRQDQAVLRAQSAAEVLKQCGGDLSAACAQLGGSWDGECWQIGYDRAWQPAQSGVAYTLTVRRAEGGVPGLGTAEVEVTDAEGSLFQLRICWQEVNGNGG